MENLTEQTGQVAGKQMYLTDGDCWCPSDLDWYRDQVVIRIAYKSPNACRKVYTS